EFRSRLSTTGLPHVTNPHLGIAHRHVVGIYYVAADDDRAAQLKSVSTFAQLLFRAGVLAYKQQRRACVFRMARASINTANHVRRNPIDAPASGRVGSDFNPAELMVFRRGGGRR